MQECHEGLSKSRMSIRQLVLRFRGDGSEDSLLRCLLVVLVRRILENVLDRFRLLRIGEIFDHDLLDQIVDEGVEGRMAVVVVVDIVFARSECVDVAATDGVRHVKFEQFGDQWLEFRFQKFFANLWAHQI